MACIVHHRHSKTGIVYVYESESHWNKEKQRCECTRKCIGHLDPETNEVVPNRPKQPPQVKAPIVKSAGPALLLDNVCENLGLNAIMQSSFPDRWDKILTCAYYLLTEGNALCHCEQWSAASCHPSQSNITSQQISQLLESLDSGSQHKFFEKWVKKISENEYFALDITSISSYSDLIPSVKYGYNRDGESLPQINMSMLVGEKSGLPVYYERYPGSIHDVSTLQRSLQSFTWLDAKRLHLVMDKGFCSLKNISALYASDCRFTISMSRGLKFTKEAINEVKDTIVSYANYWDAEDDYHYVSSSLKKWDNHRCYVHVYYDPIVKEREYAEFMRTICQCERELVSGETVENHSSFYQMYFTVTETPKRGRTVTVNEEALNEQRNGQAGYFVLISNDLKDPKQALEVYRQKDSVEKAFDNIKNELDGKRLRVHSEKVLSGRIFVQFISQIIYSEILRVAKGSELYKKLTIRDLIMEMKILSRVTIPGKRKGAYTELTANQKKIVELFGIKVSV